MTTTNDNTPEILRRADAGEPVADISAAVGVTPGRVYSVLREHRPDRRRKPRERTSRKPAQIKALAAQGVQAPRIAEILGVSRQYVYRELGTAEARE